MTLTHTLKLQPRPPIYDEIFVFGTGEHPVVGDWTRQPELGRSYLLAARHAIEVAERDKTLGYVALPVAFLQRHAIELELKRILAAVYSIKQDYDFYDRLKANPTAEWVERSAVPEKHGLIYLLQCIDTALVEIKFDPVPQALRDACDRIAADEKDQHERHRYLKKKRKKGESFPEDSFPKKETIHVIERQHVLEDLYLPILLFEYGKADDEQNWITRLFYEENSAAQAIEYLADAQKGRQ